MLMIQQVAWSNASIGGIPLDSYPGSKTLDRTALAKSTKQKAASLINSKGSTEFGIGSVSMSICKSILFDQRNVRPVSIYCEDLDVCLSKPVVLGWRGVEEVLEPPLDETEKEYLKASGKALREVIEEAERKEKEKK